MPSAGRRAWVLLGALLLMVAGMLPVTLTGALAVQIRADLGIGSTGIGVLVSVFFTAGAFGSQLLGSAADHVGWRRASVVGGVASASALLAFAVVVRTPWAAALVLGVGGAAMTASVATSNLVLAREMPGERLGLLLGLKQSAVPLSGLASGLAVPVLALRFGWRWAFAAAAMVPLLAALSAAGTPRPSDERRDVVARVGEREPATPFVVSRRLRTLAVGMGFSSVIPGVLTGFIVLTAVDAGLSEGGAGVLLAACSLLGVTVRVGYGWAIDHVRGDAITHVAGLLVGGAVGTALVATGDPRAVVVGALLAFACGWGWPGLFFYELIRDHPRNPAAATGVSQTGALIGSALGPLAFGWVADTVSTGVAWVGTATLATAAAAVMLRASRLPRPVAADPHGADLPPTTSGVIP